MKYSILKGTRVSRRVAFEAARAAVSAVLRWAVGKDKRSVACQAPNETLHARFAAGRDGLVPKEKFGCAIWGYRVMQSLMHTCAQGFEVVVFRAMPAI